MDFLQHNTIDTPKPKRGRPRKEIKKEIEDDVIDETKKVLPTHNLEEYSIKKVGFNEITPNVILGVGVYIDMSDSTQQKTVLMLEQDCKKTNLTEWLRGIGGIFNRDIKRYLKDENYKSLYFAIYHQSGECFLVRMLDEALLTNVMVNMEALNIIEINSIKYILVREFDDIDCLYSRFDSLSDRNGYLIRSTEFKEDNEDDDSSSSVDEDNDDYGYGYDSFDAE